MFFILNFVGFHNLFSLFKICFLLCKGENKLFCSSGKTCLLNKSLRNKITFLNVIMHASIYDQMYKKPFIMMIKYANYLATLCIDVHKTHFLMAKS